ncbi:NADP-dependent oxidoreductase [Halorientalis pallida]|uniref:NADP-dependent oxidoreductase n=1 Tax=Halorientalis pallida TaxID=2479928 RepID=A0A498L3H4_9EURY|nr:NADP-dependent oxidoreductase [Halorientalis pallida]RXK50344.1 NADP-dependent oxidoreductase [Halorientalis pallida]
MAGTNRQWILESRPTGEPTMDNFDLRESEIPEPDHGEVLVESRYLSVDPYMRGRMRDAESYAEPWDVGDVMQAGVVGDVVESNHPEFEEGDVATGNLRWAEYAVADGDDLQPVDPDLAPVSTALGVLGMPGRTAYFGTLEVAEPEPGDTVLVSGAAGAVGSVVGQISKLAGARVVGIAGADEKIDWLTEELGFDAGINYKEADNLYAAVGEACPDGVDAYFDNVGGEITDAAFAHLNVRARVAVCGQISLYNATERPMGPRKLAGLIETRARVEGLLVRDWAGRFGEATEQLAEWVQTGDVQYRETVTEGFENMPEAFLGLFDGVNIGKQLVEVE